jgi:alpha-L-fucosidase
MNISWPMIPGRALAKERITDPAERERIIREQDWNLNGKKPEITPNQYWSMAKDFNPTKYDPDLWLKAAKEAGFTYAVLTTRHHEGFALWPSAYGNFDTKNFMGGRDLLKDYIAACRRNGLKVGFYYSPPDWNFDRDYMSFLYGGARKLNPEFPSLDADLKPRTTEHSRDEIAKHQAEYAALVNGQVEELLTRYGKIDLLWFDGKPAAGNQKIISPERIRELQPGIVINPRRFRHLRTHARHRQGRHQLGRVLQHLDDRLVAPEYSVPRAGLCARPTGEVPLAPRQLPARRRTDGHRRILRRHLSEHVRRRRLDEKERRVGQRNEAAVPE